jgi:hypothetical protein
VWACVASDFAYRKIVGEISPNPFLGSQGLFETLRSFKQPQLHRWAENKKVKGCLWQEFFSEKFRPLTLFIFPLA